MKQILITGAAGSLGIALAKIFVRNGHRVLGLDLNEPKEKLAEEFRFLKCDLANADSVGEVLGSYQNINGAFDLVINNAGIIFNRPLVALSEGNLQVHSQSDWINVINSNLTTCFNVCGVVVKKMIETRKSGVIINISSISNRGNPGQVAYSAAKAGVVGLSMSLGKELGPLGIRVVALSPGFIDTESTRAALSEDVLTKYKKGTPLKKLGSTDEVYSAVQFIFENGYMNATEVRLDGGFVL
jgi:3-oxoacyl-[acyl-carrier protein] reductase